jgi:hypothetical protein
MSDPEFVTKLREARRLLESCKATHHRRGVPVARVQGPEGPIWVFLLREAASEEVSDLLGRLNLDVVSKTELGTSWSFVVTDLNDGQSIRSNDQREGRLVIDLTSTETRGLVRLTWSHNPETP